MGNGEDGRLRAGDVLKGHYRLIEEIGSGGGGIVYKAYHESLKKYVVVKQIRDAVKVVIDSRGEDDIIKNLRNSYLPQVYDFGETDGVIYTVIDYIEGESLDKVLAREGRFSNKEVLKWANQLADALAYLHRQNPPVIHSDIKPANIILTANRDICLIDFNISLAFDRKNNTSTGTSEGYSPPEQYHSAQAYRSRTGAESGIRRPERGGARFSRPDEENGRKTEYGGDGAAGGRDWERHTLFAGDGGESTQREGTVFAWDGGENAQRPGAAFAGDGGENAGGREQAPSRRRGRLTEALIGKGVDERSDIYSLGATLYTLLTGACPDPDFERIVPLSQCPVRVSDGFCKIIEKMMNLDPEERFRNGGELLRALKDIRKYDARQRSFRTFCVTSAVLVTLLWAAGAGLVFAGGRVRNREIVSAYNQELEDAARRIDEGDFDGAERLIDAAMERIPTRIDAYARKVLMLYDQGDYRGCVDYGRSAVNSPPYFVTNEADEKNLGDILFVMGNAYYELEDYANAVNCLETAISYNPENSAYYRDLGIALARAGNPQRASEILEQAVSLGIEQGSAYMLQGEIAYAEEEPEEAEELFLRALDLLEEPDLQRRCVMLCAKAYEKLGGGYLGQEIEFLETWIKTLDAGNGMQLTEQLAELYAKDGRPEEALEEFQKLRDTGYVSFRLLENMAILYQQTDQLDAAEEILKEAADRYPDRYETYKRLAFLEADRQQRLENGDRDYGKMREYYETAKGLYQSGDDAEMWQLENMMRELSEGGWFEQEEGKGL